MKPLSNAHPVQLNLGLRLMMRLSVFGLLLLVLLFAGCNGFTETAMKGMLEVDRTQIGGENLEVKDADLQGALALKPYRLINPGKKLLQFRKNGISKIDIIVRDSMGVKLARITVPTEGFDTQANFFSAKSSQIDQIWGLKGTRVPVLLRVEYAAKTGGRSCTLLSGTPGVIGSAWQIRDTRYDYELNFVNEATGKNMATFKATGSKSTDIQSVQLPTCEASIQDRYIPEAFE